MLAIVIFDFHDFILALFLKRQQQNSTWAIDKVVSPSRRCTRWGTVYFLIFKLEVPLCQNRIVEYTWAVE